MLRVDPSPKGGLPPGTRDDPLPVKARSPLVRVCASMPEARRLDGVRLLGQVS
jgi:hypothetical protein